MGTKVLYLGYLMHASFGTGKPLVVAPGNHLGYPAFFNNYPTEELIQNYFIAARALPKYNPMSF
jgi:hypothetical protein